MAFETQLPYTEKYKILSGPWSLPKLRSVTSFETHGIYPHLPPTETFNEVKNKPTNQNQ